MFFLGNQNAMPVNISERMGERTRGNVHFLILNQNCSETSFQITYIIFGICNGNI